MPVLVRIAFRNLLEHKAKSLIIGVLLALGVIILVVGNAFMDTAARGVKDTFIGNYTADVFIHAASKYPVSLFGVQAAGGQEETKGIPDYDRVLEIIAETPGIAGSAGQITGFGLVSLKEKEAEGGDLSSAQGDLASGDEPRNFALLFGVNPEDYYRIFDNASIVEGRFLEPGKRGLVISKRQAERYAKSLKLERLEIGQELLLTGMGKAGFKIQSVPLIGIIEYKSETDATDFISYADSDTLRILMGLTLGNDEDTPVSEEQKSILAMTDEDALFGAEEFLSGAPAAPAPAPAAPAVPRAGPVVDSGAWHFQLIRLENPGRAAATVASLNKRLTEEGIGARAAGWKAAAGPFALSVDAIRVVFNVAVIIVAVVAVIIMMNTLLISVIERTGEIGTMRALGAQKGFVRRMFLVETITIASVFGAVGVILAFLVLGILNAIGIEAGNPFLQILFAGDVLHATASLSSIVWSLLLMGFVAVVAHLYPVSHALRIEPVSAMQTE